MTFYECKFLIKLEVGLQIRNEAKFSAVSFHSLKRGLLYEQEEEEEEEGGGGGGGGGGRGCSIERG